ncbi:MAG: restriction endonuclease [Muribaculaceae bacterium]|nr:restriction endonuclease [Muribaculaceae bacterium]
MNRALELGIEYANQKSYLDDLFRVYPTIPEGIRDIDKTVWNKIEVSYQIKDNVSLISNLLSLDLFPIKDSYVAYLKRDKQSINRNRNTVNRLAGRAYEMGLDKIFENCSQPKETNRQIGPMFKNWINKGVLGLFPEKMDSFISHNRNAILDASDSEMMNFAKEHLNYNHDKGLDFVARFNNQYIIGEAKFLTDFGGHQNAQFNDAISTITTPNVKAVKIAILDGVLYIPGNNKLFKSTTQQYSELNIMSSLVLREFLYSL